MFSCEYSKIFDNTYFEDNLQRTSYFMKRIDTTED